MNILHINCNYTGTTLHQIMVEHLDDLDINSSVFVPTYDADFSVIRPNPNVCISKCFNKRDRLFFDYKQRKIIKQVQKKYDMSSFDCIHAYTLFTDGNCAMKLSKKYHIPYVVAVRNTDVNSFFKFMLHLRHRGVEILRHASKIIFLSQTYKAVVLQRYVPKKFASEIEKKSCIIPNGIDEYWFDNIYRDKRSLNQDPLKLVYAGRIDKNKNIPIIQKTMKILRNKGIRATLTVVGKVVDEKEFLKIKADKYTTVLPPMGKEDLKSIYRANDIFVMPSHNETFGLVYAEAMSQGLPVLYTKGQGFDEQFKNGLVGYAVSDTNADNIAENVIKIIQNYEQISGKCIELVDSFDWAMICQKYQSIYTCL